MNCHFTQTHPWMLLVHILLWRYIIVKLLVPIPTFQVLHIFVWIYDNKNKRFIFVFKKTSIIYYHSFFHTMCYHENNLLPEWNEPSTLCSPAQSTVFVMAISIFFLAISIFVLAIFMFFLVLLCLSWQYSCLFWQLLARCLPVLQQWLLHH